jgi:phosphoribosylaminoimidazole-succinocarboxamide synthase
MKEALLSTNIPDYHVKRGKVRDIYDIGEFLVIVTTDRLSAFDKILPSGIPDRGRILTQMTEYWCDILDICTHLVHTDIKKLPEPFQVHADQLLGRVMLVEKAKPFPVECVVRGYLCGSAWQSYKKTGMVCGIKLPKGLQENSPFPKPLFTPTTKSDTKDEEITYDELCKIVGSGWAADLEAVSLECYYMAAELAWKSGIIIADTKFEWGTVYNELVLIDEVLTPDSSRFWPLDKYVLGESVPSFDKQYVRDYLTSCGWDKKSEPPSLPDDIINNTRKKYLEVYYHLCNNRELVGLNTGSVVIGS